MEKVILLTLNRSLTVALPYSEQTLDAVLSAVPVVVDAGLCGLTHVHSDLYTPTRVLVVSSDQYEDLLEEGNKEQVVLRKSMEDLEPPPAPGSDWLSTLPGEPTTGPSL